MSRNYQQAKIYCIKVNTEEEYLPYVGSSCKRLLSQRMNQHRDDYRKWKKGKYGFLSSFTLFEKYGVENCYIELLESCPCKIREELLKKEREHIEKIECVNINKPFTSKEEKIEEKKITGKIYYETHKEQFAEKGKIYRDENKEQINEKAKIYRDENKEIIAERMKVYRDENKEQIVEKAKEKYECVCGSIIRKDSKTRHEKSKKHQNYLTELAVCTTTVTDLS